MTPEINLWAAHLQRMHFDACRPFVIKEGKRKGGLDIQKQYERRRKEIRARIEKYGKAVRFRKRHDVLVIGQHTDVISNAYRARSFFESSHFDETCEILGLRPSLKAAILDSVQQAITCEKKLFEEFRV